MINPGKEWMCLMSAVSLASPLSLGQRPEAILLIVPESAYSQPTSTCILMYIYLAVISHNSYSDILTHCSL